jgi:crossover junction endodeoxyribonuclease RuvC
MVVRMFVMGIDPGLSRCGYAVVEARREGHRAVALGVITTPPSAPLPSRLAELQREVRSLIAEHRPVAVAVERVLFQVNVRTAMSVGQASGIAMAEAATAGCDVVEYSPNQVKDAVAGWGGAGKAQMQQMVQMLLRLARLPEPPDAADAAALALTQLAFMATAVPADAGPNAESGAQPVPGRPRNAVGRAGVASPGAGAGR